MTTRLDAERALRTLVQTRESYRQVWTALMGDGAGKVVDPESPDYCFVRVHGIQNSVARVLNKSVASNRPNLPVLIGTTRTMPEMVQVLQVDWSALPNWEGLSLLPLHGAEHQVPGPDPVYVQKRAIVPLRASPQSTPDMTVHVEADFYPFGDGFNYFEGADSEDLTSRVPGGGLHRFVTVYVDGATNSLAYVNGDTQQMTFPLGVDMIPRAPEGSVPICAVRLYNGMTEIKEADLFDMRIIVGPAPGSIAPKEHGLDPVEGRHTGTLDTSHLEARVACTGAT